MSPSPSTTPGSSAAELTATGEPLAAGHYTRTGSRDLTLDLDGSWQAVQLAGGFFDVQQEVGSPDVIAVQFAIMVGGSVARWDDALAAAEPVRESARIGE